MPKTQRSLSALTANEFLRGHDALIRIVQTQSYTAELALLATVGHVARRSPLLRLLPFVDPSGLLRVGDCLQHLALRENEKHPLILSARHLITELLIRRTHLVTLLSGPTLVRAYLSQRYWIMHGRNTIRRIIRQCPMHLL